MITGVISTEKFRPPQFYSLEQVKHHNSPEDLWMIIYNKIYDITEFAQHHPGGVEVLFDCGGIDATEAFDDVSHSDDAFKMLAPYFMGDLIPQEQKTYKHIHNRNLPPTSMYSSTTTTTTSNVSSIDNSKLKFKRKKKKNSSNSSNNVETWTILVLVILVIFSLILYIGVQKLKWSYHFHSS